MLNITIAIIYIFCKVQFFRFLAHYFWIFFTLITISTFSISFVFGILSVLAYDSKNVLNFIFSNNNLLNEKYLIKDKNTADVLNICLNYGGDFATELINIKNTDMIFMDNIYKYSYEIMEKDFHLNKTSNNIKNLKDFYTKLLYNIELVKGKPNDLTILPKDLSSELRKWSDFYVEGSYQVKCDNIIKDAWVTNRTLCPDTYEFISSDLKTVKNYCLLIPDWTENNVRKRYEDRPSNCEKKPDGVDIKKNNYVKDEDFDDFETAIITYWEILYRYNNWHMDVIGKILKDLEG